METIQQPERLKAKEALEFIVPILERYGFRFSCTRSVCAILAYMSKGRDTSKDGRYRAKREDTLVRTIEKKYNVDLKARSDAQLHTVLRKHGAASLSQLLKKING